MNNNQPFGTAKKEIKKLGHGKGNLESFIEVFENIMDSIREPLLLLDSDLKVLKANHSFYQTFNIGPDETKGTLIYDIGSGRWNIPTLRKLLEDILSKDYLINDFEVNHNFETIGRRLMRLNASRVYGKSNQTQLTLLAIEDVTNHENYKRNLEELVNKRTAELIAAREEAEKRKKIAETALSE